MKHDGLNNPDSWVGDGFKHMKRAQVDMIRKAYPDYREDKDYVLWIIPDLYHPYACDRVTAKIKINYYPNSVFDEEVYPASLCSFNVQQPYPNKRIYQLSLVPQDKRKRIFGIPLVFKTYDEIRELSSVSIDWTVYDTDKACSEVFASHLSVNYRLSFPEIEPDEHFFTINTCDRLDYCFSEKESVSRMKYYEAFSVCLGARGIINIILDGIPRPLDIVEIYDLRKKRRSRKANAADDALIKQFYDMGDLSPWFPDIAYIQELCEAHGILEPQYLLQYLHQDVSMTAAPAADFVPEPAFGFKML